jgi:dTDP-4-dehydrorhamnose 3,5-epimerase
MIFKETTLAGAFAIEPEPIADSRGFFSRLFCAKAFAERGLNPHLDQITMSHNARAGIVRGLHLQRPPHGEAKLVRVTTGAIFDVAVDVRAGSRTYGRWFGTELSAANRKQLYIPAGFAHGFQTLSDTAEVAYHISAPYAPDRLDGIRWDDPDLAIAWPDPGAAVLSERDAGLAFFARFEPIQVPC